MKKPIARLLVALAVAAATITAVTPVQASSAAAVKADAIVTNYVVDPASPGPGVYCIEYMPYPPPAGWAPSQHWNNFVPRGSWASQIGSVLSACTTLQNNKPDGDGFWIDPNHHVSILKWAIYNGTTGAGDWFPVTSITGNQSYRFLSSGDYLLRVYNGAS